MILARCGCGGGQCNCSVIAGNGTSVDGTGSTANPYVISVEPPACEDVRGCFSAGDGISFDESTGVISARPSADEGNGVSFGSDGGLLVPASEVSCEDVRPCFSAGDGLTYDEATGEFGPDFSADAGNNLTTGSDGGLYVPTGAATVSAACGLTGDGSGGSPLAAAVGTWSLPCDVTANAGQVYCDANGVLRSEPRGMANFYSFSETREYANLPVPSGQDQPGDHFEFEVTNPDPCRPALAVIEREADVDFVLPANGGGAAYGHGTDEMYYVDNQGNAVSDDVHAHTTKVFALATPLAPGETRMLTFDVTLGRGKGGATYNRIQAFIRCLLISL
ncbi:hypothetical protein EES44_24225 [Streptomyces sp. ADI96-15]|nr:hypothetical protein EES44_24225 [Streptomyces sp. ADI96-15]